jgi:hypothetical protein
MPKAREENGIVLRRTRRGVQLHSPDHRAEVWCADLEQQLRGIDSDVARTIDDANDLVNEVLYDSVDEHPRLAAAIIVLRRFWGPFIGRRISEEVGGIGSMGMPMQPTEYQNALEDILQHEVLAAPCLLALAVDPNCNNGCRAMALEGLKAISAHAEDLLSDETLNSAADIIAAIRVLAPGSVLDSGKKLLSQSGCIISHPTVRKACQFDEFVRHLPVEILMSFAGMDQEQISAVRLKNKHTHTCLAHACFGAGKGCHRNV